MAVRKSYYVEGMLHGQHPVPSGARIGPLLMSSLINGIAPDGTFPECIEDEAVNLLSNIERLLEAVGGTLGDVVSVQVEARDRSVRDALNPVWEKAFPDRESRPARHVRIGEPAHPASNFDADVVAYIDR